MEKELGKAIGTFFSLPVYAGPWSSWSFYLLQNWVRHFFLYVQPGEKKKEMLLLVIHKKFNDSQ